MPDFIDELMAENDDDDASGESPIGQGELDSLLEAVRHAQTPSEIHEIFGRVRLSDRRIAQVLLDVLRSPNCPEKLRENIRSELAGFREVREQIAYILTLQAMNDAQVTLSQNALDEVMGGFAAGGEGAEDTEE